MTAPRWPWAKRATITIPLDHSEDVATQVPMISRVLYLLVIDILAVGVAMRTGAHENLLPVQDGLAVLDGEKVAVPGNRLARMVSHSRS